MHCRSIADILRKMGEIPPSDINSTELKTDQLIEIVGEPPVSPGTPWLDWSRIAASRSRDVLAAIENGRDDRTLALKRVQAVQAITTRSWPSFIKFGAQAKAKSASKPKQKRASTPETKEYFARKMRELRARQKADALVNSQGA